SASSPRVPAASNPARPNAVPERRCGNAAPFSFAPSTGHPLARCARPHRGRSLRSREAPAPKETTMATAALRSDAFAAQASINVTPLIDVLLVLLMILMLTTPLTTRRVPLPLGAGEPGATPPLELQLALKPTGELY